MMANSKGMRIPIILDTSGVMKQMKSVEKSISQGIGNAMRKATDAADMLMTAVDGVKTVADLAVGAFDAIGNTLGAVHERMDELHRADLFGTNIEEAKKLQQTLSDVKTTMGALRLATELKTAGFSGEQVQNFGGMINAIAALTGDSKLGIEKGLLAGGKLTERQLRAIGKTKTDVQLLLTEASAKLGGRPLDELEKAKVLTQAWGAELKQIDQDLGRLGASNPFDDIKMSVASIGEEIFTSLTPAIREWSEWLRKHKANIVKSIKAAMELARQSFTMLPKFLKQVWANTIRWAKSQTPGFVKATFGAVLDAAKWVAGKIGNFFGSIAKLIPGTIGKNLRELWNNKHLIGDFFKHQLKEGKKRFKELTPLLAGEHKERLRSAIAKEKEISKKTEAIKARMRAKIAASRRGRAGQQGRLEAAQERLARIRQARTILRNFEEEQFSFIARLGARGATQLVAGAKETINRFKVFAAAAGKNFMDKGGKASKLMNLALQSGSAAADRIVAQFKQRNEALKSGLSLIAAEKNLTTVKVEQLNEEKTTKAAIKTLDLGIAALSKSRHAIAGKIKARMESVRSEMIKQRDISRELIQLRLKQGEIDMQAELAQKRLAQAAKAQQEKQLSLQLKRQIENVEGPNRIQAIKDAGAAKADAIKMEIELLQLNISTMQKKLALEGLLTGKSRELAQQELSGMQRSLASREANLKSVALLTQKQIEATGSVQTIFRQARVEIDGFSSKLGQQLYQGVQGGVSGIGNLVSSTMESVVSGVGDAGANAGKLFLDVLAGAAAQLGAFYITAGTAALFIPPYTGAGSIAGGLGLLALAGTLKGLGSLVGASATKPSTPSASGVGVPPRSNPPTLPGQRVARDERAVNFFFASSPLPWQRVSEQQQVREMSRWGDRMAREGRDPFNVPRTLNAKRFA